MALSVCVRTCLFRLPVCLLQTTTMMSTRAVGLGSAFRRAAVSSKLCAYQPSETDDHADSVRDSPKPGGPLGVRETVRDALVAASMHTAT